MGIQSFPLASSGFDPSKYSSFGKEAFTNASTASTWFTVYSVTGKGFLTRAMLSYPSGTGNSIKLRLTVDGTVTFLTSLSRNGSQSYAVGIMTEDYITNNAGSMQSRYGALNYFIYDGSNPPSIVDYPYTTDNVRALCLLANPIFFNTSLLVEVQCVGLTYNALQCSVNGAVYTG